MFFLHLGLLFYFCMSSLVCSAMYDLRITSSNQTKDYTRYNTNKKLFGVAYPSNDTVLVLSDNNWLTFDLKTEGLKQHFFSSDWIQNFDLKDEMLAIATSDKIVLFNVENGKKEHVIDIQQSAFIEINFLPLDSPTHNKMIVYNPFNRSMFTVTCDRSSYNVKDTILDIPIVYSSSFAVNLKNKKLCVLNTKIDENSKYFFKAEENRCPVHKIFDFSAIDYSLIKEIENYDKDRALSCVYNSNGKMLAVQTINNGYVLYKINGKKYKFHVKIDFENKTSYYVDAKVPCYTAIAFHPYKSFVALVNQCNNSIDFHSYVDNNNTLLATIGIDKLDGPYNKPFSNKQIVFSPNGRTVIAINRHDKFYIIPTPLRVYFDKNTNNKCIFLSLVLNEYVVIPWDIKKLIFHNIAYSADF